MKYWLMLLLGWFQPALGVELIQNIESRNVQRLDGQWNAIIDAFDVGDKRRFYNNAAPRDASQLIEYHFASSLKLKVPGDWNTQNPELFRYEGSVWYQRDFTAKKHENKHYILHFGAVNYLARVYLNGKSIGQHEGGFTPFQFEVSDQLIDGKNSLHVAPGG